MLFKNVWYVADFSANLTTDPLKVRMLGRDFVLFRDTQGRAHCLSSVCCHRGASLAQGKCHDDDTLACPFHGWRFNGEGQCTMIPSAATPREGIPKRARVDAYPTQEKFGLVWVFLGDEPAAAHPLFDMPEYGNDGWRMVTFTDTWKANLHVAKWVDLDQVHLHIVHGIPLNEENPSRPSEHQVTFTDNGFCTDLVSHPPPRGGSWATLRTERATVKSHLSFYVPGFTLYGRIDIGMPGSGFVNAFYSLSTPVDEENTRIFLVAFRNFMLEEDKDKDHLNRNLRNVYQDKAIAEGHQPKRTPDREQFPDIAIDREDRLLRSYWELMRSLRARGWQLDRLALDELDRRGDYRVIASPARHADPNGWVYGTVPVIPADPILAQAGAGARASG
jgi:phenylpropionate dioxygenase-like ring-hydroxylating dioxygenase large terminal subunit